MQKIKLLTILAISAFAINASAQEIAIPDIIAQVPEKSIEQGNVDGKKTLVIKQEEGVPIVTKSLMFSEKDSVALESAVLSYIDNAILKKNIGVSDKPLTPDITQVYLGSIIYRTGQESLVWVSGQKFKVGETKEALTVTDINKEDVTIKWDIGALQLGTKEELAKNAILFDDNPNLRTVTFNLKLNQRLDVAKMKILAGKLSGKLTLPKLQLPEPSQLQDTALEGAVAEEFMDISVPKAELPKL